MWQRKQKANDAGADGQGGRATRTVGAVRVWIVARKDCLPEFQKE